MNRRTFLKALGATVAAGSTAAGSAPLFAQKNPHVAVVGGGVGGATLAKYLKIYAPSIDVTIIEPKTKYQRPYGSSEVITGHETMDDITISYDNLRDRYGVKFIHDTVTVIDHAGHKLHTAGGRTVSYDRVVVAPGISFDYSQIEGLDSEADARAKGIVHGWDAGEDLLTLKAQLEAMPKNGTAIVVPPPNPYRCPPGPYERAGLLAQWLEERGDDAAKVIVLDSKNGFTTDVTMLQAWNRLYKFNLPEQAKGLYTEEQLATFKHHEGEPKVDWIMGVMGGKVTRIDAENMIVETEGAGTFKADMINYIPPLKAGRVALENDLADETGWCPVDPITFESTRHADVHVIGDACIAGAMPKSGYAANSQGKVLAVQLKALLLGGEIQTPVYQNTCYALAGNTDYGMFVADVFRVKDGKIVRVDAQRYLPFDAEPHMFSMAATYQQAWMKAFTKDVFG
ncbi:MAG TPA: twin-arginine translocation signal domain-containing protein [Halothiobacillaceae bacterium]|nr:twin-arginine translocation signal domain-containing protein [Halothiobacillaceae bacterium]